MDLSDANTRERMLDKHPIVTKKYTVITPMIHSAYSIIREMVWLRHTGLFMYATPRMGKTRCACAIQQIISAEFPDKYPVYHVADDNRIVNFARDLEVSLNLVKKERETYSLMIEKIILHVRSKLSVLGGDHFVLIVDEIQLLTLEHYKILLVIHNRLESLGICMTTVGFGQPSILQRRELLNSIKAHNLVARFLSEAIRFDGCLSAKSFLNILFQFDHEKQYPVDSGCSFTNFFLPCAFAAGFRLSSCHERIWSFLEVQVGAILLESVPLEHIFRIIENILVYGRKEDCDEFTLSDKLVQLALDRSRVGEFLDLTNKV
ncbi:ATP-binding protein [Pseudomonas sp. ERGC3:05]|nr:ATP-binding protein [Pseudomonas sp. ERGC3:01]QZC93078.1 ATP-binding protein [Pseudomonas sp. ERGC3:05]